VFELNHRDGRQHNFGLAVLSLKAGQKLADGFGISLGSN
jgi:hypothetical protein